MRRLLPLVLLVLAACGHSSPTASPDASPDAAPDSVSTTLLVVNAPPGSTVLFYDAGGTLIDRSVTNHNGIATGNGAAGGSVTAVPPMGAGTWYTWLDVGPNDNLYTQPVSPGTGSVSASVILPRDGDADSYGAVGVGLDTYNTMPPASGTITSAGTLASDAPAQGDVVASASHPSGMTRYFVAHGAQLGAQLDLSSGTWADPVPLDREVDHFPADTAALSGRYSMLAGGRPLWTGQQYVMSTTTLAMHVDSPGTVGDGSAMTLWFQRGTGSAKHFWQATFNGVDATIDLATVLPPDATSVQLQGGNKVTWQVTGDPTHAVGTWLAMYSGPRSWLVIGPGDLRIFTPPQLPADIAAFPAVNQAAVTFINTNEPAGYAGVRNDPSVFDPQIYGTELPPTPGTFRIGGV